MPPLDNVISQLTLLWAEGWTRDLPRSLPTWSNLWHYDEVNVAELTGRATLQDRSTSSHD